MNIVEAYLKKFNKKLDQDGQDHNLNEKFLSENYESLLTLEAKAKNHTGLYWISMGKLMELTLICAGNFADHGYIKEMGYLVAKPRETIVHIDWTSVIANIDLSTIEFDEFVDCNKRKSENNLIEVLLKHYSRILVDRNRNMTDQFEVYTPKGMDSRVFLRDYTRLEHTKQALIPELKTKLETSGYFSETYLSSIDKRTGTIVTVAVFTDISHNIKSHFPDIGVNLNEQKQLEKEHCGFDKGLCDEMSSFFYRILERSGKEIQLPLV